MSWGVFASVYTVHFMGNPQTCRFYYSIEFINPVLNDSQNVNIKVPSTAIYEFHSHWAIYINIYT